jgi:hypothetical protein
MSFFLSFIHSLTSASVCEVYEYVEVSLQHFTDSQIITVTYSCKLCSIECSVLQNCKSEASN